MYHYTYIDFGLSKEDLMRIHYPVLYNRERKGWTFDYSIPQTWVDWVKSVLPDVDRKTMWYFVWVYDDESINGEPLPLSKEAQEVLLRLNELEDELYKDRINDKMRGE